MSGCNPTPTLNEIIFNPSRLEDFLIENKRNKYEVIKLLREISHDFFSGRSKDSVVYQTILNLVVSIVHHFKLQVEDLEGLFTFEFIKSLYELLIARNPNQYHVDYFRLFLRNFTKHYHLLIGSEYKPILDGMIQKFWLNPREFKDQRLIKDLQEFFVNGSKERSEIYKLFKIRPSQSLLHLLQDEAFALNWFLQNYSSTTQLSSNERDLFFQLIQSSTNETNINTMLEMVLSGTVDFFNSKCFVELFFTKLLLADYSVIGSKEERLLVENEALLKERINHFMTSNQLEQVPVFLFYPNIKPKNHPFIFFLVISRLQLQNALPSLGSIPASIYQKLPIERSTVSTSKSTKVLLSGLEYETFNFKQFCQSYISCLEDAHWKWTRQIFSSLAPVDRPEDLVCATERDFKHQLSSLFLYGGIYWLERRDYQKAFSFLNAALKNSLKQHGFPHLKFASFCKNALFEVCFVLINELQDSQNARNVCSVFASLNDQIPTNLNRIIFLCANLINYGMINPAIELAKNFLHVTGKKPNPSKQSVSLLKAIYNSCICISLFNEKQEKDFFSVWSPKQISLLVNASDSLFRNISNDPDMLNLFIGFLSLLDRDEDYLDDFIGLFIGNLNLCLSEDDGVCLKYFSKYALFYANHTEQPISVTSPYSTIRDCNEQLSAQYRPSLDRKEGAQFSVSSLKSVVVSLYEKPSSVDYYRENSTNVLGYAEIVFLQGKYSDVLVILLFYLMEVSNYFSLPLAEIENLPLINERMANCMWKLGHFDNLLLFAQLLEKRTKFWFAAQLAKLDMIADEMVPFLFDLDLIEYLAADSNCEMLHNHMVKKGGAFVNCNPIEIKTRLYKFIAIKYFGL